MPDFADDDHNVATKRAQPRAHSQYDRAVVAVQPLLTGILAAFFAVYALAVPFFFPGSRTGVLGWSTAGTAVLLAGLAVCGRAGRLPPRWGHRLPASVVLLVAANADLLLLLTRDPDQTSNVELALVVAGAALVATRWMLAVVAVLWTAWLACAVAIGASPSWPRHALGMLAATLLAGVISESRRRNLCELIEARDAAEASAVHDHLTGLANRRGLALLGNQIVESARRRGEAVHAVFLDVDGLKRVNDRLGHEAGDAVLVAIADALRSVTRASDVAARWGGDEFCLVGPGPGGTTAELERRVREHVLADPPVDPAVWSGGVSLGAAFLQPGELASLEVLLAEADAQMYGGRSARTLPRIDAGLPVPEAP